MGHDAAMATNELQAVLQRAVTHAQTWLDGLDSSPVQARRGLEELRARLGGALPTSGTPPVQVIDELVAATEGGHLGSAGGRFFAWVIGGSLPSALAADWLTSAWDQNAGMAACGPAAAVAEEVAGQWLLELLGLPKRASFGFTTGCQMAHFTCLAAARHQVLKERGWDVNQQGLFGAPPIRVVVTEARHSTIDRALRFLGLGLDSVRPVGLTSSGAIDRAAFERELDRDLGPTIVVLDAADLNIGAFDAFDELIPLAKARKAWVHIDGAFGLFALASRSTRSMLKGVELADSWATDAHKWLNVPYDSGFAVVANRDAHRASMTTNASYLALDDAARDQLDWNPEFSRRARGIAVYAALRELGAEGVEVLVDRCCTHARALVDGLGALRGVEVLWRPTLNQGLVRFPDPTPGATEAEHDRHTDRIIAALNATGEAFFGGSTWHGKRVMRISVVNFRTNEADVARAVAAAKRVLG
jgi:glutamate/tyrosine decarboxylase-like PLP-dependent enzyme